MFRIDAFGNRVLCMPRLSFNGDGGAGAGDEAEVVELDGEKFNFPPKTAVADMTDAQAREYWRHEAKKQQKKQPKKPADYDQLKKDSEDLAKLRMEKLPEDERKLEQAREQARLEGEVIGSEKYLKEAVKGRFQALTKLPDEDVETAFAHVDATSFVDDNGDLDIEAVKKFASTFGLKGDSENDNDPVRDALRNKRSAGGGKELTMAERREAARDRMSKKKPTT